LGKVASATWTEQADGVTATYTGGSSDWESKPREVVVHMKCSVDGHNSFGPAYQDPDASTARYYINLTLADACGKAPPLPDPATCQEVLYEHPDARDGEFVLKCPESNVALSIWCHDMAGGSPKEYLSLPFENNYAEYLCGPQCKSRHPTSTTVTTTYTKVRINPCNLTVDIQDRTFSTSSGSITHGTAVINTAPFGVAASCEDSGGEENPGKAMINLEGSPLAIASGWQHQGTSSYGTVTYDRERMAATILGGGYCGDNAPIGFHVYAPPAQPQWVLQLRAEGPPAPPSPPPPPPPHTRVSWIVAGSSHVGDSCTNTCQAQRMTCVEDAWPTSLSAFNAIIGRIPNANCTTTVGGTYPSNPQRTTSSGPGLCEFPAPPPGRSSDCPFAGVCWRSAP
jgi:hypothetical protein